MTDQLKYRCDNDACPLRGIVLIVLHGESADCAMCGWSLAAVYE